MYNEVRSPLVIGTCSLGLIVEHYFQKASLRFVRKTVLLGLRV